MINKIIDDLKKFFSHRPSLYGYDLSKWEYLGHSIIEYTHGGHRTRHASVFFFVNKKNALKRQFVIDHLSGPKTNWKNHTFVMIDCNQWKSGIKQIYTPIISQPSQWLMNYMLEKYGRVWDNCVLQWVETQYNPTQKPKIVHIDNIVNVDFQK